MLTKTVIAVERPQDPKLPPGEFWSVIFKNSDGIQQEHRFSHETLLWRAAEYGIDPADSVTLLDIVLHEPHISTSHEDPEFLYNTDQDTARVAHLRKISVAKSSDVTIVDPKGLFSAIHKAHVVNSDHHARRVHTVRQIRRGNNAPHITLGARRG